MNGGVGEGKYYTLYLDTYNSSKCILFQLCTVQRKFQALYQIINYGQREGKVVPVLNKLSATS